jgi:hypothetical protein
MKKFPLNEKGFLGLIEMLVVLVLICFSAFFLVNKYFKPQISKQQAEDSGLNEEGSGRGPISYTSVISKTRDKVEQINERTQDRYKQFDGLNK